MSQKPSLTNIIESSIFKRKTGRTNTHRMRWWLTKNTKQQKMPTYLTSRFEAQKEEMENFQSMCCIE
jgi:hypothetical protein